VRGLARWIAACTDEIERLRRLPDTLVGALHEAGFFRLLLPRMLGGAELDPPTFVQVIEALARVDASTAWVICQTSGCSMVAASRGEREALGTPRPRAAQERRDPVARGPSPRSARLRAGVPAVLASPDQA
jgi:alkylation response protein AidB-like acyl-CoA dehydrogenase